MSAAYFLARSGVDVTVFERRDALGGIVRHVIPEFRIPGEAIDNDAPSWRPWGSGRAQHRREGRGSSSPRGLPM